MDITVVSTKIMVLEISKVSDSFNHFYSDDTPRAVADAILNCPILDRKQAIRRIVELDSSFEKQLKEIILCLRK